jgi:predicted DNA-binding ribbon-helix-helix protein
VTRSVTVEMSPFSRESVQEQASRQQIPLAAFLRHAVLHYLSETDSGRLSPRMPRFSRVASLGDELVHVDVDLEDSEWSAFEAAAEDAGVSLSRLLGHAALLYLGDLNSGLVAERLLDGDD